MRKQQTVTMTAAALGMLVVILEAKTAAAGIREGIQICLQTLIPSLFPFMVLSILLTGSMTGQAIAPLRWLGRLCRIPKGAESLLAVGLVGGYPVGAQNVSICANHGVLTREDAQRMTIFCNNAGPAFIFGMLGPLFEDPIDPWLLWAVQITGAVLTGYLLPGGTEAAISIKQRASISFPEAMNRALRSMATVCGWVILFRMILKFLERWILWLLPIPAQVLLTGFLELSNGCIGLKLIESRLLRFVLASVMLPFGGLCVTMQTASVSVNWKFLPYLSGKLLQAGVCLFLSISLVPLLTGNSAAFLSCMLIPLILSIILLLKSLRRKKEIAF